MLGLNYHRNLSRVAQQKEMSKVKLLTKKIEARLPALYSTETVPAAEKEVIVKFFSPTSSWTWYACEYDPETQIFFGYVEGTYPEWGYFSLKELEECRGLYGLGIERDRHFTPGQFKDVVKV